VDEVLDAGGEVDQVFAKQIVYDKKHQQAEQTLNYLKEKHTDIVSLEQSLAELNQLFQDMQLLVETQGEMLDQIEYSVAKAKGYNEEAVHTMARTEKIVNKTRRKKCCICIITTIIIVILLVVLVVVILVIAGVLGGVLGGKSK